MRNKKVLAIVMAVMTAASALVGCGSTNCRLQRSEKHLCDV